MQRSKWHFYLVDPSAEIKISQFNYANCGEVRILQELLHERKTEALVCTT